MNKQIEVLQSTYKIEEDCKKDALLSVISDKYCRAIINATIDKSKSAIEISEEK